MAIWKPTEDHGEDQSEAMTNEKWERFLEDMRPRVEKSARLQNAQPPFLDIDDLIGAAYVKLCAARSAIASSSYPANTANLIAKNAMLDARRMESRRVRAWTGGDVIAELPEGIVESLQDAIVLALDFDNAASVVGAPKSKSRTTLCTWRKQIRDRLDAHE